MQNPNDNIGNGTRDVPACTAAPQTIAPPSVPFKSTSGVSMADS